LNSYGKPTVTNVSSFANAVSPEQNIFNVLNTGSNANIADNNDWKKYDINSQPFAPTTRIM
jgi:hypothetical protein